MPRKKSILAEARGWALKNKLFGNQAFLRYVMLRFVENLSQVSNDFVFKGGNLLWVYISTPRATIDLDLATITENSHDRVREIIESACMLDREITYSIHSFRELNQDEKPGAAIGIQYLTEQGAKNRFEIDIVYSLAGDYERISSPINPEEKVIAAIVENIISDKLSACHRFKSGNTRIKDYDDLWRLSQNKFQIDRKKLTKLLKPRKVPASIDLNWINPELIRIWKAHQKRYPDLPTELALVFDEINSWLAMTSS